MTQGTGKRSYRACLRCRQRKTRCNLDGVGEPKKPPCVACHHSGSECTLVASRRGGRFRQQHPRDEGNHSFSNARRDADERERDQPVSDSPRPSDDGGDHTSNKSIPMELRNPSDALQILARSGDPESEQPSSYHRNPFANEPSDATYSPPLRVESGSARLSGNPAPTGSATLGGRLTPMRTVLNEYELIRTGSLHPDVLPELLRIYSQEYHPYCPIAPHYLLGQSGVDRIQKSDHFLLSVILTIASRDLPDHSLTHRRCWDHTQNLLSGIVLAHPWAQSPRTVQGLLLLSEWLPHIQVKSTSSEANKSLFAEDRTAWSLVGLAVRQAYLLRLDQAAFCEVDNDEFKEREEQKRIIWTFVYLTDRQISARLGQAFWSRGPSVSSQYTADDFPSLRPTPGVTSEDLACVLQATIELIQILHNAHGILYSSAARTLDMVHQGDYARYLDDFQRSASTWHATWDNIKVRKDISNALFIMYEYLCLYVNAFAFQAVLTRTASPRERSSREQRGTKQTSHLFSRGIMSTWDGQYIFNAINAARNLLSLMNDPDTRQKLCYLPSRYWIYGVYAAVFLHKALHAEVFQSSDERRSVTALALEFTSTMERVPPVEPHICHDYGRMLRNLWRQDGLHSHSSFRNERMSPKSTNRACPVPQLVEDEFVAPPSNDPRVPVASRSQPDQAHSTIGPWTNFEHLGPQFGADSFGLDSDSSALRLGEGLFSGSFFPGVTDFGQQEPFSGNILDFGEPWMGGL